MKFHCCRYGLGALPILVSHILAAKCGWSASGPHRHHEARRSFTEAEGTIGAEVLRNELRHTTESERVGRVSLRVAGTWEQIHDSVAPS